MGQRLRKGLSLAFRQLRKHLNFYRCHMAAFAFAPLVSSAIFWGANGEHKHRYVDCLFMCMSAMTVTGLNVVELHRITLFQQTILFFLLLMGSLSFVSMVIIIIRKHYFDRKLGDIIRIYEEKHRRRIAKIQKKRQRRHFMPRTGTALRRFGTRVSSLANVLPSFDNHDSDLRDAHNMSKRAALERSTGQTLEKTESVNRIRIRNAQFDTVDLDNPMLKDKQVVINTGPAWYQRISIGIQRWRMDRKRKGRRITKDMIRRVDVPVKINELNNTGWLTDQAADNDEDLEAYREEDGDSDEARSDASEGLPVTARVDDDDDDESPGQSQKGSDPSSSSPFKEKDDDDAVHDSAEGSPSSSLEGKQQPSRRVPLQRTVTLPMPDVRYPFNMEELESSQVPRAHSKKARSRSFSDTRPAKEESESSAKDKPSPSQKLTDEPQRGILMSADHPQDTQRGVRIDAPSSLGVIHEGKPLENSGAADEQQRIHTTDDAHALHQTRTIDFDQSAFEHPRTRTLDRERTRTMDRPSMSRRTMTGRSSARGSLPRAPTGYDPYFGEKMLRRMRRRDHRVTGYGGFPSPFALAYRFFNSRVPALRSRNMTRHRTYAAGLSMSDDNEEDPEATRHPTEETGSMDPGTGPGFPGWNFPSTVHGRTHGRTLSIDLDDEQSSVAPYLTFDAVVGKNSVFLNLSPEQRDELMGVEYKALTVLLRVVFAYWLVSQCVGVAILAGYIEGTHSHDYLFEVPQYLSKKWFVFFQSFSSWANCGLSLVDSSMADFKDSYVMLFVQGFLILMGNTAFPIVLRFIVWVLCKTVPSGSLHSSLRFLLDHPRRCYLYLFPSFETYILALTIIVLTGIDWVCFVVLDLGYKESDPLPPHMKWIVGLFQSLAVRSAGYTTVSLSNVSPALQLLYVIMMYIAVYPLAMSIRSTNVYSDQSMGIYDNEDEASEENADSETERMWDNTGLGGKSRSLSWYLKHHAKQQLAFDMWWLMGATWIVCIIERTNISSGEKPFLNVFSILFEVTSAYGTVGLSLGNAYNGASLSYALRPLSKLVIIFVMFRGRHRGLPSAIDRSVLLPRRLEEMRGDTSDESDADDYEMSDIGRSSSTDY